MFRLIPYWKRLDDTLERTYEHGLLATETQAGVRHRFLRGPTKTWVTGEQSQRGTGPIRDTEITRDGLGRVASMKTNDGTKAEAVRTFSLYDAYGKPWLDQNTIGSINVVTGWVYDRKGRPLSRTTSGTGLPRRQTTWSWYHNNVLAAVHTPSNKVLAYNYGPTFDHQLDDVKLDGTIVAQVNARDLRGAITSMTLPAPISQTRTYAYDALGRTHRRTSGVLLPVAAALEWNATFHPDGKLRTETIQDNVAVVDWINQYEYDAAGRLDLEVAGKTGTTYDYVLDAAGNRLTTNVTPASGVTTAVMNARYDGPKLVRVNTTALTYNDWNEVSTDHHGNAYTRSVDGELAAITHNGATTVFSRDARAVPIAAIEAFGGDNFGTRRTAWDIEAGLPLEVEEADGTVLTYLKVEGIHVGTAENGVLTGVSTDPRETELKHGGQVFGAATSFGEGTVAPNNSDERFMFAMLQRVPSASEVMLARRRTYDPMTGRWLEPDPFGADGGLELHQYGEGDPVNFVDPMGTTPVAIGADCSTDEDPPIIHFDPIRPQLHQALGMEAPPSTFDVIAGSSLGLSAFLTSLAEGSEWILDIDGSSDSPYAPGPLCVVNCAMTDDIEHGPDDGKVEEITVYGKRLPDASGRSGGGGGDDDPEPDDFSGRGRTKMDTGDLLADAFADIQRGGRAAKGSFAHTKIKRDVALPASVSSEPVPEANPNRQASMVQRFAAEVMSEWDRSRPELQRVTGQIFANTIIFPPYESNPVVVGLEYVSMVNEAIDTAIGPSNVDAITVALMAVRAPPVSNVLKFRFAKSAAVVIDSALVEEAALAKGAATSGGRGGSLGAMKSPAAGPLIDVNVPDAAADALAARIDALGGGVTGGVTRSRVRFTSANPEYDAINDLYIGQTTGKTVVGSAWRKQARRTFEAAFLNDRIPVFEFTSGVRDAYIRNLDKYSVEYNIPYMILE